MIKKESEKKIENIDKQREWEIDRLTERVKDKKQIFLESTEKCMTFSENLFLFCPLRLGLDNQCSQKMKFKLSSYELWAHAKNGREGGWGGIYFRWGYLNWKKKMLMCLLARCRQYICWPPFLSLLWKFYNWKKSKMPVFLSKSKL